MLIVFRLMLLVLSVYVVIYFVSVIHDHYYPVSEHEMTIDLDGDILIIQDLSDER